MGELEFLTVKEFAEKLKVPQDRIRDWLDGGRIRGIKITESKRSPWRIPYTELRRVHAQAYEDDDE